MKNITLRVITAVILLHAALLPPLAASAAEVQIRFPLEYSLDVAPGIANQEFKQLVEARSNGEIEVIFYPSGSLYKGLDLLQATMRGDVQMTTLISAFWTAISPQLSVFELPYAFPTMESFYLAVDDTDFMTTAFEEIDVKGAVVLGVLPYDYLVPGTRATALRQPEDFSGLRIRGLGQNNLATLGQWGAKAISLNLTELSPALEQGLIDGLNGPVDIYVQYKWYEHLREINFAPYYLAFYPWAVNKRWWQSLSENHRQIIQNTVREVTLNHRQRARTFTEQAIEDLRIQGVNVHMQSTDERRHWAAAAQPVWDNFEKRFGHELLDEVRRFQELGSRL